MRIAILVSLFVILVLAIELDAQNTAFNFQGRLNDGSTPANGNYSLIFKLFDSLQGGTLVGATERPSLALVNGVFSTTLDFGASAFTGADRFLEIGVKPAGSQNAYATLGARQQLLAVPYAIRANSAATATQADSASFATTAINATLFSGFLPANFARLNYVNNGDLQTSGSGGFGPKNPNTRLTLSGGPQWTGGLWTASMNMQNGSAFGWEANDTGQLYGIGHTNDGLYLFHTTAPFGNATAPAQVDLRVTNEGNFTQPQQTNGFVKGMLAITANGTIARCYNGVTGSTTVPCGFNVQASSSNFAGFYYVIAPFPVNDRFWIVTPDASSTAGTQSVSSKVTSSDVNRLTVYTFVDNSEANTAFHLLIF